MILKPISTHPESERESTDRRSTSEQLEVDTYDGKLFIEWDPEAAVTPLAQLPFFIQFLKLGCRFELWVDDCPLTYKSPNAPEKVNVLGSLFLSVLSGHNRYAHMTALLNDGVSSTLLGMSKVVSDDSARRALKKIDETDGVKWLQTHLQSCYEPLLNTPWILDCDVTVKPLYGRQEGAEVGYNPHKPGRPSHTYHTYLMANLRLVLDVEVQAGNQTQSMYSAPGLLALLDRLPQSCWPRFVRGDCDWGSEPIMQALEEKDMDYLFKLKKSGNVKKLIMKHHGLGHWTKVKAGWEAKEDQLQLAGWSTTRRVVVLRRRVEKENSLLIEQDAEGQQSFGFIDEPEKFKLFEYSVLVTSLEDDVVAIMNHYRDRADCENVFDEIKNQWGWGGYTTRDLTSCRLMSRNIALIYNWWSLFVRMMNPPGEGHREAMTTRPLMLSGVGRVTQSGRQKVMTVTNHHGRAEKVRELFQQANKFFSALKAIAPQLSSAERWCRILEKVVEKILPKGCVGPPKLCYSRV
ncbi:MAG: transposase [Gammaproteobacteria bacterium]